MKSTLPGLAATEARLAQLEVLIDHAADGLVLIDVQSLSFIHANAAAAGLLNTHSDDLMREGPAVLARRSDYSVPALREFCDRAVARFPESFTEIRKYTRANEAAGWLELSHRAVETADRWAVVGTLRDVTERITGRTRQQYLRAAMDQADDAIAVIDPETLAYLDVNEGAARLTGRPREELMAQGPLGLRHALGIPAQEALLRARYEAAIANYPEAITEVTQSTAPDGRPFVLEATRRAVSIDGKWLILAVNRDITQRHAATQRLERLRAALNEAADAIVVIDPEAMAYEDVNQAAARMLGLPREQMMALGPTGVSSLVGDDSMDSHASAYRAIIARHPASDEGLREFTRSDGVRRTLEYRRRAVHVDGRWLIVHVGRDVTDRVAEQKRLQRLQAAIDQSDDAIVVVDPETLAYVEVNGGAERMARRTLGYSREEWLARGPLGVRQAHGIVEEPAALRARYATVIERYPETLTELSHMTTHEGLPHTQEVSRRAILLDGKWLILAVNRDITERHAATQRLEHLLAALNEVVDAIVVIDAQTNRYVDVNEAAARLVGLSREELLEEGPLGFRRRMGLSDGADEWNRRNADLIAAHPQPTTDTYVGSPTDHSPMVIEVTRRAVRIDGRWLILGVHRDITERHAATHRLEQLNAAVNESPDVVVVIDPEAMTYLHVNRAAERVFGLRPELMLERGVEWAAAQTGIGSAQDMRARFQELIASHPRSNTFLHTMRRSEGTMSTLEITRRAILMEGRWLILNVARDVTERVRAEQELQQRMEELARSNRDLEQFAYVTSHDLSEPLRMVTSYIQLLERRYAANFDADAREFMGFIVDGATRMKRLIDDLLVYSRAGRASSEMRELTLDRALDEALANLAHAIREGGVTIERPEPLPEIPYNKTGMTQLFQNLVGNAIKFRTGDGPTVRITAEHDGADWIVSVKDNGIGIEPQYFSRIFEIFQRLHARTAYEGTGIGLAICKKIVERHGGVLWVESQPGQGTSFRFRLPAQQAQSQLKP